MDEDIKKELIDLIEKIKLSKAQKEQLIKYIKTGEKPKDVNSYDYSAFYDAYNKIRTITNLGNKLIELDLIKK